MPLKLSLRPGESFILNGAVVRNGDRRGSLLLETQARILREKDVMFPEEATTPARQAYFLMMQIYLVGSPDAGALDEAMQALERIMPTLQPADRDEVLALSEALIAGDHYRALGRCRRLIARLEGDG